jgi:hypothetical protein
VNCTGFEKETFADEKRTGSSKYCVEANRQAREFARRHGLKYVSSKASVETVREKPLKRYKPR